MAMASAGRVRGAGARSKWQRGGRIRYRELRPIGGLRGTSLSIRYRTLNSSSQSTSYGPCKMTHNGHCKLHYTAEPYIGYPCPWVLGGHRWAPVLCIPASNSKSESKLLGCRKYANQEALRTEANDSGRPLICPIQPRLGVRM